MLTLLLGAVVALHPMSEAGCDVSLQVANACVSTNAAAEVLEIGARSAAQPPTVDGSAPEADVESDAGASRDCVTEWCRPTYSVEALPDVTAEDLASFRPDSPAVSGEPEGLGITGSPTNVLAQSREHTQTGTLFGDDVTVRFTPLAYHLNYGDGHSATSARPGTSWKRLGQPEYTPTPTSHTYATAGTYTVTVRVEYAAAVDLGTGSFRPVIGTITSAPSSYSVRVVEITTALVQHTCLEDPDGPAC